jgi:cytochrome b561
MPYTNSETHYGLIAQLLHWGVFVFFISQFVLALLMLNWPVSDLKWTFYDLHKSFGITLFFVALFRLFWRFSNTRPTLPAALPYWQRRAAGASHAMLYVCMVVMPISGYIGSKAGGYKANWFGLAELPDLFGKSEALNLWAEAVHRATFYLLVTLVVVHAAAALRHHYRLGDEVLVRMWPLAKRRRGPAIEDR